jgi:acyl dehydratase
MREGLYYEEFSTEQTHATSRRTVTETDVATFTTLCGFFEPIFMDQEYVEKETPYGRRIAPAALTFSIAEGLSILSGIIHKTGMALLGVDIRVLGPVFVGDTLSVEIRVGKKRSTQKPDRGIVQFRHRVLNQRGEGVMQYTVERMIKRKAQ